MSDNKIQDTLKELTDLIIDSVVEETKLKKEDFVEIFKGVEILVDKKINIATEEIEKYVDKRIKESFVDLGNAIIICNKNHE